MSFEKNDVKPGKDIERTIVADGYLKSNNAVTVQRFRYHMGAIWALMASLVIGVSIVLIIHSKSAVAATKTIKTAGVITTLAGKLVDKKIAGRIRKALPNTKIEWIRYTSIKGVFEFKAGKSILYTDSIGRFLLVGHVWDLKYNRDLTQISKDKYLPKRSRRQALYKNRKIDWKTLPLSAAVRYGNPLGQKIAVFHDPDCPYCKKMKQELTKSNRFDVYQIMYPIQSLHPGAYAKSQSILCKFKKIPSQKCDMSKALDDSITFAKHHNIRGTPTVVTFNGDVLVGYRPVAQLLLLMAKSKKPLTQ
ncbi:hypothetical protein MNBD_GAMMA12-3101 [hydrothermal vent metagenome]|uniref:Thiol:disulfide interchange protein DsbC n=1 Tax=hydrothermal vent metagenome TaxID=652676 RepID=A0A3B0Z660_9ZZZZ